MNNKKKLRQIKKNRIKWWQLKLFVYLESLGGMVKKLQTLFNTDSAQLDKSIFVNKYKYIEAKTIAEDYTMSSRNPIYNIDGIFDSINGYAYKYGLTLSTNLYKKVFPVLDNTTLESAINSVMAYMDKTSVSASTKGELGYKILKELKKYIYANNFVQNIIGDETISDFRKKLFFDIVGKNSIHNESLASFIKNNLDSLPVQLFNSFDLDIKYTKLNEIPQLHREPSTISLNINNKGEKINDLYLLVAELLNNDKPILKNNQPVLWNGEPMTYKRLGQYLVLYSFLEGGIQEATQFTTIIPIDNFVNF